MTGFVLKIVASVAMILGHSSFINDLFIPCYFFGRLAFPIFAFLLVEGYVHTRSYKKYLTRIIVFGVISQLPAYRFFMGTFNMFSEGFKILYLNIFFTFTFGLIALKLYDLIKEKFKKGNKVVVTFLALIPTLILAVIAENLNFDYGFVGVALIMLFYIFRGHKSLTVWAYTILMTSFMAQRLIVQGSSLTVTHIRYVLLQLLFLELALIFISLYNGKRGKDNRNLRLGFYFVYPVHFIILLILKGMM